MHLEFKPFQKEHYPEYATWFDDPDLNHALGPMDEEWLHSILAQPESEGVTWAVFRADQLVAVVEIVYDPQHQLPPAITAIATKPTLRRQGIATTALHHILSLHHNQGITEHMAFASTHNPAGRHLLEKAGFIQITAQPNEHGYHEYRHHHP